MHYALRAAVDALPVHVRTAFYVAGKKNGVLRRKTWNNCAFNVATGEGSTVTNAQALNIPTFMVQKFINAWDRSIFPTDELATEWLMDYLPKLGLDPNLEVIVPPRPGEGRYAGDGKSFIKNVTTIKVFENEELNAFNAEVQSMIDGFTDTQDEKSEVQLAVEEIEREFALV